MQWFYTAVRRVLLVSLLMAFVPSGAQAQLPAAPLACDPEGTQANGALYLICVPPNWNGKLIVYAHGYIAPNEPLANQITLPDGSSIADAVQFLGFAFATTSYNRNGLAVLNGIESIVELVGIFQAQKGVPQSIYLLGASQGGLVTTLAVEQWPHLFDGGLALCGPYGNFAAQLDYFTDARVVFDYFFPGLLAGTPISIPQSLMDNWSTVYTTTVQPALLDTANAGKVDQLLAVVNLPYNTDQNDGISDAEAKAAAIADVLWYNIIGSNDGIATLGGSPYDNQAKVYSGSADDTALNQGVQRFSADAAALVEITARYQTNGNLHIPLVTVHTSADPIVPYSQVGFYQAKVEGQGRKDYLGHIPVAGYGHCVFTLLQMQGAFALLEQMVATLPPYQPNQLYLSLVVSSQPQPSQFVFGQP
jgi:pimeloyl-ACP methyl ester carboxylesterase